MDSIFEAFLKASIVAKVYEKQQWEQVSGCTHIKNCPLCLRTDPTEFL